MKIQGEAMASPFPPADAHGWCQWWIISQNHIGQLGVQALGKVASPIWPTTQKRGGDCTTTISQWNFGAEIAHSPFRNHIESTSTCLLRADPSPT